jgi:glycosyltransferase involved in cell wall biosynthesis
MKLVIVVPCYNEEAVLPETAGRLMRLLADLIARGKVGPDSRISFVDDGSRDRTWSLIEDAAGASPLVTGLKLSRNRGHQAALMAGLMNADADAVISIDADLQDDLAAIEAMVDAHVQGADVVYGVRRRRDADTFAKRFTAETYYRLLGLLGVEVVFNHADYRLLSRRVLAALAGYGESNLFLRGIIPQLGFPSAIVHYDRAERFAGKSKYPLRRMLSFAWQGITSFSAAPLRLITTIGVLVSAGSFGVAAWALWLRLFTSDAVPGWTSTVVPMYFLGGVQLLCIGIIGEYLAKIYVEVKRRPAYFVERQVGGKAAGAGQTGEAQSIPTHPGP